MKTIVFVLFGLLLSYGLTAQNREIEFRNVSLEEAKEMAKKENKLIFLDCYGTYCPPCRTMEATVFKTDSVADFVNATFVNVKMNMDDEPSKPYSEKYKIGAVPSYLLLDAQGEVVYKFVGGMSADKFMAHLRKGMNPENRLATMNAIYASGKYSKAFMCEYIQAKLELLEKEECVHLAKNYFDWLTPKERALPENWFLFTDYTLCPPNSANMHYLFEHWRDFVKVNGEDVVFGQVANLCRSLVEWELRNWKYERKAEDFDALRQALTQMDIPERQSYSVMMDVCKAHFNKDVDLAKKLLVDNVADFSAENQQIMFSALDMFTLGGGEYDKQFHELARRLLTRGEYSNFARFVETLIDAEEIYGGERYDVQALQDKIGTTSIIPFFHPTEDKFWYVMTDKDGGKIYYSYDARQGKKELYDTDLIDSLIREFEPGATSVMVFYDPEFEGKSIVAKLSTGGKTYLYDARKKMLISSSPKQYKSLRPYGVSPNWRYELFEKEHNLWLRDSVTKTERQLTFDGNEDAPFWTSSIEWLGTAGNFYVTRRDERRVRDFAVLHSCVEPVPTVLSYKYEIPGDSCVAKDELYIGDVVEGSLQKVEVEKWPGQLLEVYRVPDVEDKIFILRKKRTRDEYELCAVNPKSGEIKVLIHEISKPYLSDELFRIHIVNRGKDIFVWSDRSGWGHYYHYSGEGELLNEVTTGEWTAGKIVKIDTLGGQIYFYGYGKEKDRNPNYAFLYRVDFDGSHMRLLTPENANHQVYVSPSCRLIVDNFSRIDTIPQIAVRNTDGKLLTVLERPDISKLLKYGWKYPEQFVVKAADGKTDLYGIMWKPFDFDSTKVYPIISQVYPGPFTETVWTDFTVFDKYNNTALAQRGFIVVCMGHRGGSPYRAKAYATYGHGNLRDYPLADDICGIRQLGRRFSFIDTTRVGIVGHSGGGMMAVAAICTYPDFYKVAVASSGNYDNRIYNRTWGETYQGLKEDGSFHVDLDQDLVGNLKGHLLLVTGDVDQNVHPAHTLRLVNALILNDKDFDLLILPNQGHHYQGPYGTYFERKKRDYFTRYLK